MQWLLSRGTQEEETVAVDQVTDYQEHCDTPGRVQEALALFVGKDWPCHTVVPRGA